MDNSSTASGYVALPKYDIENQYGIDYKEVLRKMIRGVDIAFVDPTIYPQLPPYINELIEYHTNNHDIVTVQKLEFYKKYIAGYPKRQAASALIKKPIPPPPVIIPALSPEEVETEINYIFSTKHIKNYPDDELELIVSGLRKRRSELISNGDYLGAQKANHFCDILISHGQLTTVEGLQREKVHSLEVKLAAAKSELEESKKKWEQCLDAVHSQEKEEMQKLIQTTTAETEKLEQQKSPDFELPASYQKYSQNLLNLRRRADASIAAHHFTEASELTRQADELQIVEDAKLRESWNKEVEKKIRHLEKNHEKMIKVRKDYFKASEHELIQQAEIEIQKQVLAIEHLERSLKIAKEAMKTAKTLRKESIEIKKESNLPPLPNSKYSPKYKAQTRQKQILNTQIYTRFQRNALVSPRK